MVVESARIVDTDSIAEGRKGEPTGRPGRFVVVGEFEQNLESRFVTEGRVRVVRNGPSHVGHASAIGRDSDSYSGYDRRQT
ncbi:hypothetical protein EL22_28595 [Halostagnicola sp. A56]|nr:hypothetical protein EL22_28595 [Halostagnicola sp. A56]